MLNEIMITLQIDFLENNISSIIIINIKDFYSFRKPTTNTIRGLVTHQCSYSNTNSQSVSDENKDFIES